MNRIPEYERGFRDAAKEAVTLLHTQAFAAQDPVVRKVLHTAALTVGNDLASWECRTAVRARARLDSDRYCVKEPVPLPID